MKKIVVGPSRETILKDVLNKSNSSVDRDDGLIEVFKRKKSLAELLGHSHSISSRHSDEVLDLSVEEDLQGNERIATDQTFQPTYARDQMKQSSSLAQVRPPAIMSQNTTDSTVKDPSKQRPTMKI